MPDQKEITFGADEIEFDASQIQAAGAAPPAQPVTPTGGYWENKSGERLTQAEVTADPKTAHQQLARGGWQWHPPAQTGERVDRAIVGGVPVIGSITPEDLFLGRVVGKGALATGRALASSGPVAATGTAASHVLPFVKYEMGKNILTGIGLPEPLAALLAGGAAGYRGRGSTGGRGTPVAGQAPPVTGRGATPAGVPEPVPPVTATPAPVAGPSARDVSIPVRPSELNVQQLRERLLMPEGVPAIPARGPLGTPAGPGVVAPPPATMPIAAPAPPPPIAPASAPPVAAGPPVAAAPPVGPAASLPVAPAPPVAAAVPVAAPPSPVAAQSTPPVMSPQRARNEVGLAAYRQQVELTPAQYRQAEYLVRNGQPSTQVVADVAAGKVPVVVGMSPQQVQNELGLAARRAKVTLTKAQYQQAEELARAGQTPAEAVTNVSARPTTPAEYAMQKPRRGAQPAVTPAPAAAAPAGPTLVPEAVPMSSTPVKVKISAAETGTYLRLRHMGKSDAEAKALIQLQRDLAQRLNMPSSEAVRQSVAGRNVTGEWPE